MTNSIPHGESSSKKAKPRRRQSSSKPSTPNTSSPRKGRLPSVRSGRGLESLIRDAAQQLAQQQRARLYQWPIRVILTEKPSPCSNCGTYMTAGRIQHTERGGCDFFGFTRNGRHVAIEAKCIDKPSLKCWVQKGDGLKVHQLLHLRDVDRAGGAALIVWQRGEHVAVFGAMPITSRRPGDVLSVSCLQLEWHPLALLPVVLGAALELASEIVDKHQMFGLGTLPDDDDYAAHNDKCGKDRDQDPEKHP